MKRHGRHFVSVEFGLAALASTALALAVLVAAMIHSAAGFGAVTAVTFFAGVTINSIAVAR
jgi:hypothetical protein